MLIERGELVLSEHDDSEVSEDDSVFSQDAPLRKSAPDPKDCDARGKLLPIEERKKIRRAEYDAKIAQVGFGFF